MADYVGSTSTLIYPGNSAYSVQPVSLSGMDSSLSKAVDRIAGSMQYNSEWNARQAAIQRDWSLQSMREQMSYNAAQAAQQRDWQEYMSSTAHQREVADLKAAGLNPVLSATGGNGAPVSSGATASVSLPSGSSAQADTSGNAAIVSLLGHFLQSQTNLQMADVSAKTNMAVADKYNAMSQLVAELSAATSRYGYELSHEASHYASDTGTLNALRSSEATKAAAAINAAAARYGYDISDLINSRNLAQELYIKENYPDNKYRVLNDLFNEVFGDSHEKSGFGSAVDAGRGLVEKALNLFKKPDEKSRSEYKVSGTHAGSGRQW